MSVRAAVASSRLPLASAVTNAAFPISHADRMRLTQKAMPSREAEHTGVKTSDGKQSSDYSSTRRRPAKAIKKSSNNLTNRIKSNLPPKKTLVDGYNGMEFLKKYSRRMAEKEEQEGNEGKYIHDWEWNGGGRGSYYAAFNYLVSNETFYKKMLIAYGMDFEELKRNDDLSMSFFNVAVALGSIEKFKKAVPDYLDDRDIFGEFSSWPEL